MVSPTIRPVAVGCHHGAASPASAGTKVTELVSVTVAQSESISSGELITPISINHEIALPAVYTWPSRHQEVSLLSLHAAHGVRPELLRCGCLPEFANKNAPVP